MTKETAKTKKGVSLYDKFSTDKKAEADTGIVLDYGEAGKIRIHRAGGANQRFKNFTTAKLKPYTRQINAGTIDEETSRKLTAEIYAKTIIVGWDGVCGPDGEPLAFSEENVVRVLLDLPELFDDIQRAAQDASLFRSAENEVVEGN